MHVYKHFQYHKREIGSYHVLCKYSIKQLNQFSGNSRSELANIDGKHVITFRKQLINLLYQPAWTILVKLGEINMTPLIILNKIHSFIIG